METNDQTLLKSLLDYDQETGVFVWKQSRGGTAVAGSVAGGIQLNGYRYIPFKGKPTGAHRLAWLYTYGEMPSGDVDHINRDRDDNRIDNLRCATRSENMRNSIRKRTESSPLQGVCFDKQHQRWLACITSNYKQIHLGRFDTAEEAHAAYVSASKEVHGRFGAF